MRSWVILVGLAGLILVTAGLARGGTGAVAEPVVVEGPADFQAVVNEAVAEARAGLPAVIDCIEGVTIRPDWELDDRAWYHNGVIDIRVPATAPRIEELVLHELAHHLDAECARTDEVRDRFLVAQNSVAPWDSGPTWEETPAEQFAEAVTIVVLDRQRAHNVRVSPEAVEVVRRWGSAAD